MAYRRAPRRRSYSTARRAPARSTRRRTTGRTRRVSRSTQTVRLVIESAPTGMVARSPAASSMIGMRTAPRPQKAKL